MGGGVGLKVVGGGVAGVGFKVVGGGVAGVGFKVVGGGVVGVGSNFIPKLTSPSFSPATNSKHTDCPVSGFTTLSTSGYNNTPFSSVLPFHTSLKTYHDGGLGSM